ncbi:hypothetical protein HDU93_009564 [Gonapodya sp. JEL0774]|nr:hypothetical protein HDU93_009564 [Gonapodya sp. JEL0774]
MSAETIRNRRARVAGMAQQMQSAGGGRSDLDAFEYFRTEDGETVRTFYQPDEYWQSLEVAHNAVFGRGYLTWEWRNQVRGFAHPMLFAGMYRLVKYLQLDDTVMIIYAPKLLQALIAATNDYFTYLLALRFFGASGAKWTVRVAQLHAPLNDSHQTLSVAQLFCTLTSWYNSYAMTRTFSNSAEATLTTVALWRFPWAQLRREGERVDWRCFVDAIIVAAGSCILRPTSAMLWLFVGLDFGWRTRNHVFRIIWIVGSVGASALLFSAIIDHSFYKSWVFPPLQFYRVNVFEGISVFYGAHPFYWYFLQSVPVVLGTLVVPFALGLGDSLASRPHSKVLLWTALWTVGLLSLLTHKEDRFLLPVLPIFLVFVGATLSRLDESSFKASLDAPNPGSFLSRPRITFLSGICFLAVTNISLALYANFIHQRGVVDAVIYIRREVLKDPETSVFWAMPCHSTPYYSHVHADISMKIITCEPPLGLRNTSSYKDESKLFGESSMAYLLTRFDHQIGNKTIDRAALATRHNISLGDLAAQPEKWPSHVVFFEAIERTMKELFEGSSYRELDDKWRKGDVIVYRGF